MVILPILTLALFCKKGTICRARSTFVERRQAGQDRWVVNAKIKMQNAKLRNTGLVGMGVLVVASFSISRILYLLDVYYIRLEVGCQVNFNHRFHRFSQIFTDFHRFSQIQRIRATKAPRHEGRGMRDERRGTRDEGRGTKGERGQWGI
jgi:hypothetical protein